MRDKIKFLSRKKKLVLGLVVLGAIAILGGSSVYAATTIGTVTGKDGDVMDKVSINAEVTEANGSHITIKDTDTGETYQTSTGPSWYSGDYNVGDKVTVEAVKTKGDNDNGHTLQVMKINDVTLRSNFEGKPEWAGQNGQGNSNGSAVQNRGQNMNQSGDQSGDQDQDQTRARDRDGECDNQS
jgi:hypothetical protein